MENEELVRLRELVHMYECILDSIPYQITYVDRDLVYRYLNKASRFCNYDVLGYPNLIGTNILDCHPKEVRPMIEGMVDMFDHHSGDIFLKVNDANERMYVNPVRDENGKCIGFFERYERNLALDPDQNRHYRGTLMKPNTCPAETKPEDKQ